MSLSYILTLDIQVYLVVGGWSSNNHALDSTEMFSGGAWTLVGPLPAAVSGGRGFTFANTFYMAGTTNMMKNVVKHKSAKLSCML